MFAAIKPITKPSELHTRLMNSPIGNLKKRSSQASPDPNSLPFSKQ